MRLPAQLLRNKTQVHKNTFGHVLVIAGSRRMLGAAVLTSLSAMRSGAGLVTLALPESLNLAAHRKMSPVIMTLPLPETHDHSIAARAFSDIKKNSSSFQAIVIGPGLSRNASTKNCILSILESIPVPLVVDADALHAIAEHKSVLQRRTAPTILTPHPGEMATLTGLTKTAIEANRKKVACDFAKKYHCSLLLKGSRTVVAAKTGKTYINTTGNPGMATAGSGDVLSGMIGAFLAQGLSEFDAARFGAYLHGKAGDAAARKKNKNRTDRN